MTASPDRRLVSALLVAVFALVTPHLVLAQSTNLNRAEVAAIKAKLVAVQKAVGMDPDGYALESEDFSLPTNFNPAGGGKFWPITSSVSMDFTDRSAMEAAENAEKMSADFEQRYIAAAASGNQAAANAMLTEMMQAQSAGNSPQKEDMYLNIQFNMNPYAGIDPDGVVFEKPGVIALKGNEKADEVGEVTVYFDPVALRETETLSSIELKTPEGGVGNRTGVFNVTVTMHGTVGDAEAWAQKIDVGAVLAVIDPQ